MAKDVTSSSQRKLLCGDDVQAETCVISPESKEQWGKHIQDRGNVRVKVISIKRLVCFREKMKAGEAKALLTTQRSGRHNRKRNTSFSFVSQGRNLRHSILGAWSTEKKEMNMKVSKE